MFNWFKSKETVTVVPSSKDTSVLVVNNALVKQIWSGSPDSWVPYTIEFIHQDQDYKLTGAWLLKNVCKAYDTRKIDDKIYFSAVLTIKGNCIVKVEQSNIKDGM